MYIIAELAGADSLAAIYQYLKNNPNDIIIPTWVITPYELDGNYYLVKENYEKFYNFLKDKNYNIYPINILENDYDLWDKLIEKDFLSPCIACHLYCHLRRIKLAMTFNAPILTGERNNHNADIKINQNDFVLNYFENLFKEYNLFFERPLLNIANSNEIQNILKELPFDCGDKNNFIGCSIKKGKFTKKDLDEEKLLEYLEEDLKPIVEEFIYDCMRE